MFSRLLQQRVRQLVASIIRPLSRLGITPNMVTLLGLVLSIVAAIVLAVGYIVAGGALVLFAGIFDMLDGAMARVRNAATTFGAFLDSTLDRYSESIILGGLLYYALQRSGLHEALWPFSHEQQWMVIFLFVSAVGSLMVSYAKARAEGLGLECKTGLLARPERVVILAIGLLTGTTIWALALLALFSHVTAVERILHVWRATNQPGKSSDLTPLPSHELASDADRNVLDRHLSLTMDEPQESSVHTVSTSLPPLTGSIQQD